jgi:hypothetical protein
MGLLEMLGLRKQKVSIEVSMHKTIYLNKSLDFYLIGDTNHVDQEVQKKVLEYNKNICQGREKNVIVFTDIFTTNFDDEKIKKYDTLFPWKNLVRYWVENGIRIVPIFPSTNYPYIDILNKKMFEIFLENFEKYVKKNSNIEVCVINIGYDHANYFKEKIEEFFPKQNLKFLEVK